MEVVLQNDVRMNRYAAPGLLEPQSLQGYFGKIGMRKQGKPANDGARDEMR